jgi:uncharacterized lipoprotein NlpE involved in copper resistance
MIKKTVVAALFLTLVLAGANGRACAQESGKGKAEAQAEESTHAYRLNFLVDEMEDGKKINAREYSMNLNAGDNNEIRIGTRVPFEQKQGEYTYLDVGTNIWCQLKDRSDLTWLGNDVSLRVRSEISNFALPEQQRQNDRPLLRQLKIDASTVAVLGKPVVLGSVDDPNSKRQFQLEVTVTKLK